MAFEHRPAFNLPLPGTPPAYRHLRRSRQRRPQVCTFESGHDSPTAKPEHVSRRSALLFALASATALPTSLLLKADPTLANIGGRNRCDAISDPTCGTDGSRTTDVTIFPPPPFPPTSSVTSRVFLDVQAGGAPLGRLVIGLFGNDAPGNAATLLKACSQKSGLNYDGSAVFQVVAGEAVYMGRLARGAAVRQERYIDATGYVRTLNLNAADKEFNEDPETGWKHDSAGLVSMRKGGGSFEFAITTREGTKKDLDEQNAIVGKVLEGMDVLARLDKLPVNKATAYKGAFVSAGKLIKDKRASAAEDDVNKPLQKVVVRKSGVL